MLTEVLPLFDAPRGRLVIQVKLLGQTVNMETEPAVLDATRVDLLIGRQDEDDPREIDFQILRGRDVPYAPRPPRCLDGWRPVAEILVPAGCLRLEGYLIRRLGGWA